MLKKKILDSLTRFWKTRKYVEIDEKNLEKFGKEIKKKVRSGGKSGADYLKHFAFNDLETTLNFIFFLRVLDFSLRLNKNYEFDALTKNFRKIFEKRDFGHYLKNLAVKNLRRDLSLTEPLKISKLRLELLKKSFFWLSKKYQGNFLNFAETHKTPRSFVFGLTTLEKFRDYYRNAGKKIHILKPSQLLYLETALAFEIFGKKYGRLKELTAFADPVLTGVLTVKKALVYEPELTEKIKKGKIIKSGSREEIEIRTGTILACEKLAGILNVPAYILDQFLWHNFHKKKILTPKTITPYY